MSKYNFGGEKNGWRWQPAREPSPGERLRWFMQDLGDIVITGAKALGVVAGVGIFSFIEAEALLNPSIRPAGLIFPLLAVAFVLNSSNNRR